MKITIATFKIVFLLSVFFFGACSPPQSSQVPQATKPYVTNAEHVLKVLTFDKSTAVSFFIKPVRTTACEYMFVEIGRQGEDGRFETTNVLFPGRSKRENFGQDQLRNQLQFFEVSKPGTYGITGWGCKPYNLDMQGTRGLIATFTVDYGKLNYIGELAYTEETQDSVIFEVGDRADFALEQIRALQPQLEPFFHPMPMKKYVLEFSEEEEAAFEKLQTQIVKSQAFNNRIEAFNANAKKISGELASMKAVYGHLSEDDWPDNSLLKYNVLQRKQFENNETILRLNYFINKKSGIAVIEKYLDLREKSTAARSEFEGYRIRNNISRDYNLNAERSERYLTLQSDWLEADRAVRRFIEDNG